MSKQEVVRLYTGSDAEMRQRMRTMHGHYITNVAAFSSFNPNLDASFGARWLAAIEAAEQFLPGSVRIGELREDTTEVKNDMEQARQRVQTLFYYVDKAFPNNPARLEQYGKKRYLKARDNQDEMRTLLEMAVTAATRDEAALAQQGYTAAKREELEQIAQDLTETSTTQNIKKGANKEDGGTYIRLQNEAYAFGQQVNEAARVLYMTEALKRDLYRLVEPVKRAESHVLTLKPNAPKAVLFTGPLLPETELRLQLREGSGTVLVALVMAPDVEPEKFVSFGPFPDTLVIEAGKLGKGQYLCARTPGPETLLLHAERLK